MIQYFRPSIKNKIIKPKTSLEHCISYCSEARAVFSFFQYPGSIQHNKNVIAENLVRSRLQESGHHLLWTFPRRSCGNHRDNFCSGRGKDVWKIREKQQKNKVHNFWSAGGGGRKTPKGKMLLFFPFHKQKTFSSGYFY